MSSEEFEFPYRNGAEGYVHQPRAEERPASQRPLPGEIAELALSRDVFLKYGLMPSEEIGAHKVLEGAVDAIFEAEHTIRRHANKVRRAYE